MAKITINYQTEPAKFLGIKVGILHIIDGDIHGWEIMGVKRLWVGDLSVTNILGVNVFERAGDAKSLLGITWGYN